MDDQIDHALGFVAVVEESIGIQPRAVVDLGSGGGLPGLVLASCWPDARIVLVDANERRTRFLTEVSGTFRTRPPVEVIRGRTEVLGHDARLRERFDLVTSRSFGRPAVTAENGSCFLEVEGWLVVSEPPEGPLVNGGRRPGSQWSAWPLSQRSAPRTGSATRRCGSPSHFPKRTRAGSGSPRNGRSFEMLGGMFHVEHPMDVLAAAPAPVAAVRPQGRSGYQILRKVRATFRAMPAPDRDPDRNDRSSESHRMFHVEHPMEMLDL